MDLSQTINGYTVNVRPGLRQCQPGDYRRGRYTSPPGTDVELLGGGMTTTTGIRLPFSLGVILPLPWCDSYAYAYDNRVNDTMPNGHHRPVDA